jgi:hypothetical protein
MSGILGGTEVVVVAYTRFFPAAEDLVHLAQEACAGSGMTGRYEIGRIASGESFIGDDTERIRIREQLQAKRI